MAYPCTLTNLGMQIDGMVCCTKHASIYAAEIFPQTFQDPTPSNAFQKSVLYMGFKVILEYLLHLLKDTISFVGT